MESKLITGNADQRVFKAIVILAFYTLRASF